MSYTYNDIENVKYILIKLPDLTPEGIWSKLNTPIQS